MRSTLCDTRYTTVLPLPFSKKEKQNKNQAALVATHLGSDEAGAAALIERVVYRDSIEIFSGIRPFPGALAALESLKAAGFRLAALSDFPTERKLALLGMAEAFEVAFSSEETGFLKPAPEPFAELCRRLEVQPAEVLYVGNSVAYDVRGALAYGMKAAHVARAGRGAPEADFAFSDYRELVAWVGAGAPVNR
jgi:putative hydrolase of the HAD superfamily